MVNWRENGPNGTFAQVDGVCNGSSVVRELPLEDGMYGKRND